MDKEKLKNLSDEELLTLATKTAIDVIKASRDNKPIPDASVMDEVKRRGLRVELTSDFIRRVIRGEFG